MQKNKFETPHLFAFVLKHHHLQPGPFYGRSGSKHSHGSWMLYIVHVHVKPALSAQTQGNCDAARQSLRRWLNDIRIYRSAEECSTSHMLNTFFFSFSHIYSVEDFTHTSAHHFLHRNWHSNRFVENIHFLHFRAAQASVYIIISSKCRACAHLTEAPCTWSTPLHAHSIEWHLIVDTYIDASWCGVFSLYNSIYDIQSTHGSQDTFPSTLPSFDCSAAFLDIIKQIRVGVFNVCSDAEATPRALHETRKHAWIEFVSEHFLRWTWTWEFIEQTGEIKKFDSIYSDRTDRSVFNRTPTHWHTDSPQWTHSFIYPHTHTDAAHIAGPLVRKKRWRQLFTFYGVAVWWSCVDSDTAIPLLVCS